MEELSSLPQFIWPLYKFHEGHLDHPPLCRTLFFYLKYSITLTYISVWLMSESVAADVGHEEVHGAGTVLSTSLSCAFGTTF